MHRIIFLAPLALAACVDPANWLPEKTPEFVVTDANGEVIRELREDSEGRPCRKQRISSLGGSHSVGGGSAEITVGFGPGGSSYVYHGDGCAELGQY